MNVEEKSAGQENAELIFAKLRLICKLKFHIFSFMAIIIFFVAKSFNTKQVLSEKAIL